MSKDDLDDSWWNGVTKGLTNGLTDNAISRVAFATKKYSKSIKKCYAKSHLNNQSQHFHSFNKPYTKTKSKKYWLNTKYWYDTPLKSCSWNIFDLHNWKHVMYSWLLFTISNLKLEWAKYSFIVLFMLDLNDTW